MELRNYRQTPNNVTKNQGENKNRNKKLGNNNVSRSLLSQHPIAIPNVAGVHGALYGAWWYDPPGGFRDKVPMKDCQMEEKFCYLKNKLTYLNKNSKIIIFLCCSFS